MSTNSKILYILNHIDWFWSHRLPLAEGAQKAGYNVHVAVTGAEQDKQMRGAGFSGHELPAFSHKNFLLTMMKTLIAIYCLIKREKPTLVHAITLKYAFLTGLATRLQSDIKQVHTIAGLGYLFSSTGFKPRLLRALISPFLKLALTGKNRRFIFQNSIDMKLFITLGYVRKEHCCLIRGSGVDTLQFSPKVDPLEQAPPIIIMPTRLLRDKGISVFVAAARILKQRGIRARCQVAGGISTSNPLSISKDEMEAMTSDGAVEWLNHVSDMPGLFRTASFVVYTSYYREGVPKVLLEAAAMGKAIITTDHPGCREVVEDHYNGLLVPIKDAVATADAIEKLIDDPLLRLEMGKKSRLLAERQFDVRLVVQATINAYTF